MLLFGRLLSCRGAARRRRRLAHRPNKNFWILCGRDGVPPAGSLELCKDNLPSGKVARNQHRKREPVKRTEEEIVALRAGRAAKRALTGAPPHDPNAGVRR